MKRTGLLNEGINIVTTLPQSKDLDHETNRLHHREPTR
jgi:hypothetical protein